MDETSVKTGALPGDPVAGIGEGSRPAAPGRPDGPGRIASGQRVTCLPGSLPAREGGRGGGVLVSIGPKTSLVDVYGGRQRRIPNELLHPEAGCFVAVDRSVRGLRTTTADGRGWLPGWSWLGWTVAEHLEYVLGDRQLPIPPPAPKRLVIVACGARKANSFQVPAGEMYTGSYHRAARRAADAIVTPGTRVVILSARYGLLNLDDVILRYEERLGTPTAISDHGLREQAEQLGLADAAEVVVLAPAAYADLAAHVWPHAQRPLAGTRGIGDQMSRLTALARGRTTLADLLGTRPSDPPGPAVPTVSGATANGGEHTVSVRGGLVHLAGRPTSRPGNAAVPQCPAGRVGRRWDLTDAPITCPRCAAIVARRRALDRWCAMVDHAARDAARDAARYADDGTPRRETPGQPSSVERDRTAPTGPGTRRPGRSSVHRSRPGEPERPGGAARRSERDRWRHIPWGPSRDVPLTPPGHAAASGQSSRRPNHRCPRPPIGRSPPRPDRARRDRLPASGRRFAGGVPLTPPRPLTSANAEAANRSANGPRQTSTCITRPPPRPSPAGAALANALAPTTGPMARHSSTTRPPLAAPDRCWRTARGLDRTPEVRPMIDPATAPPAAGTPNPGPAAAPANGVSPAVLPAGSADVAVADVRTLRRVSRAEQERLSADAQVERRARAAQLDLELREQRRQAARRERDTDVADKNARVQARRTRRAAFRARVVTAVPRWADRALFVLPILFPMAVAWVGQIRFAMTVMGWPLAAAVVFAAGFELSTAYVARLDWLSRAAGDSGLLFRGATWAFAAGAATMNYWHAAGPGLAPNGEAVSYGLMSITGVVLWELLSTYRHRTTLRAEGKRPAARPRFGLARWIWFRPLTRTASLLALRDGYPTIDLAWAAALRAIDVYGSAKDARTAIRAGRPVPRPEPSVDNGTTSATGNETTTGRDDATETADQRDVKHDLVRRDSSSERDEPGPASIAETTANAVDMTDRDASQTEVPEPAAVAAASPSPVDDRGPAEQPHEGDDADLDAPAEQTPRDHIDTNRRRQLADGATRAQMEAFARASLAAGKRITGAELDRRFGTRDYGRRVLRKILAATDHSPAAARLKKIVTPVVAGRDDAAA